MAHLPEEIDRPWKLRHFPVYRLYCYDCSIRRYVGTILGSIRCHLDHRHSPRHRLPDGCASGTLSVSQRLDSGFKIGIFGLVIVMTLLFEPQGLVGITGALRFTGDLAL